MSEIDDVINAVLNNIDYGVHIPEKVYYAEINGKKVYDYGTCYFNGKASIGRVLIRRVEKAAKKEGIDLNYQEVREIYREMKERGIIQVLST